MSVSRRVLSSCASLTLAFIVFSLVHAADAHAQKLRVDLDRDGVRDVVDARPATGPGLLIWMSRSGASHRIRTSEPVTDVAAIDLNHDGRLDLVAAVASHSLRVWNQDAHHQFRVVAPRPHTPSVGSHAPRSLAADDVGLPTGRLTERRTSTPPIVVERAPWAAPSDWYVSTRPPFTRPLRRPSPSAPSRAPPALRTA